MDKSETAAKAKLPTVTVEQINADQITMVNINSA